MDPFPSARLLLGPYDTTLGLGHRFGATSKLLADDGLGTQGAFKCTFCYDRQKDRLEPTGATACPTTSILFGDLRRDACAADALTKDCTPPA